MNPNLPIKRIEYYSSDQTPDHGLIAGETIPDVSTTMDWLSHKARRACRALCGPATPLIVACVCLAVAYRSRKRPPPPAAKKAHRVFHRSVSMAALHGGRVALQRILDAQEARVDKAALDDAARHLHDLLAQEQLNFKEMQKAAAKLEMSGKEDEAVQMLQKALEKAVKDGQWHEVHELQMLQVEMLIYKGDTARALECNCLEDKIISDARGPLYKAVIYTMIGNQSKAKECHLEFKKIRSCFDLLEHIDEGTKLHEIEEDFAKFEKIVKNLKKEIEHAHILKAAEK